MDNIMEFVDVFTTLDILSLQAGFAGVEDAVRASTTPPGLVAFDRHLRASISSMTDLDRLAALDVVPLWLEVILIVD